MKTPALEETQRLFWDLITAPEGAAQGLETLPRREERLPGGLESVIEGGPRMSAVERLDVYATMYFYRLLDVVREDYPAVAKVVGDTSFHNLITDYLLRHPSSSPSIRDVGASLPAFLRGHALARETPWLPDLAAFEWALRDAFDGPDAEPVSAAEMQRIDPADWGGIRFTLAPTLVVLRLEAPVTEVWQAVEDERELPPVPAVVTTVRVWRKGFRVLHRLVDPPEAVALDAALAGGAFADACEAVAAVTSDDEAPALAARILQTWFADHLVVALH